MVLVGELINAPIPSLRPIHMQMISLVKQYIVVATIAVRDMTPGSNRDIKAMYTTRVGRMQLQFPPDPESRETCLSIQ